MNDSSNSMSPNYTELDIESIITAPLVAASKANVVMVTGQTRFLLDNCFTKTKNGQKYVYEPVMIEMVTRRGIVDPSKKPGDPDYVKEASMTFAIPLLCLVPLNSLAIDKVSVDFDMEITSMVSQGVPSGQHAEKANPETGTAKKGIDKKVIDKTVRLNGRISAKREDASCPDKGQYKAQQSSRLAVSINAGQLPLPVGVLALLDLYAKTIQPSEITMKNQNQ